MTRNGYSKLQLRIFGVIGDVGVSMVLVGQDELFLGGRSKPIKITVAQHIAYSINKNKFFVVKREL